MTFFLIYSLKLHESYTADAIASINSPDMEHADGLRNCVHLLLLFSLLLLRFLSEEIECYANPDENYEDDEHDYHRCTHDKTLLYTIFRLIRI